jgi:hypothetical protein
MERLAAWQAPHRQTLAITNLFTHRVSGFSWEHWAEARRLGRSPTPRRASAQRSQGDPIAASRLNGEHANGDQIAKVVITRSVMLGISVHHAERDDYFVATRKSRVKLLLT